MKTALSLALITLAVSGPALAAGMQERQQSGQIQDRPYSSSQQGMAGGQMSMSDKQTVRQVQQKLSQQGYSVQVDGVMGPNTQQALRQFQQDQGIQGSGRLDQQTMAALGIEEGAAQQAQTPEQSRRSQQQREETEREMDSDMMTPRSR